MQIVINVPNLVYNLRGPWEVRSYAPVHKEAMVCFPYCLMKADDTYIV
jgi:hypothetical protein